MQDRRDFFKSIAVLFAAATVDPEKLLLAGTDGSMPSPLPPPSLKELSRVPASLSELTQLIHAEMVKELKLGPWDSLQAARSGPHKIGEDGMVWQYGVDFELSRQDALLKDYDWINHAYVLPTAIMLAKAFTFKKATAFGQLANPPLGTGFDSAVVTGQKVSVRGLRGYDFYRDLPMVRFDTLFGV